MKDNKYGIYAGLAMVAIMTILSISGNYNIGAIKYLKYVALLIFLFIAAIQTKELLSDKNIFGTAMKNGVRISAIAGSMIGAACLILYAIDPIYAPMKFNVLPNSWGEAATIGFMLWIETIVFGGILNFGIIQILKPSPEISNA